MVALKTSEIEKFLARPDPGRPIVLVFGPDAGLVRERAEALIRGRRAVWVKAGGRNFAPAVEVLIACSSPDCRVVIEAGDLRKTAPLRAACERAKNAVALICYADAERDIVRLIDDEMRAAGMSISTEARSALVPLLGGDRLASRH